MRNPAIVALLVCACGDNTLPSPDAATPDAADPELDRVPVGVAEVAPPPPDAPPPGPCSVIEDFGLLVFVGGPGLDGVPGTDDDEPFAPNVCGGGGTNPCDFFEIPVTGANAGKKTFFLLAGLPPQADEDPSTPNELLLGLEFVPSGGVFGPTGPVALSTAPDAIASALVLSQPSGTTGYEAIVYVLSVNGTSIVQIYTSSAGSVTFTELGDQVGSVIRGHVDNAILAETDGAAFIPGGCATSLSLTFAVTQGQ